MNTETELSNDVVKAIRAGRTIEAIKLLREERGIGLNEAKDLVDAYPVNASDKNRANEVVQRQSGSGAGVFVILVVLITAAYAAYYYLV